MSIGKVSMKVSTVMLVGDSGSKVSVMVRASKTYWTGLLDRTIGKVSMKVSKVSVMVRASKSYLTDDKCGGEWQCRGYGGVWREGQRWREGTWGLFGGVEYVR